MTPPSVTGGEEQASLFFRMSDERPIRDRSIKREDDREILTAIIDDVLKSERARLLKDPAIVGLVEAAREVKKQFEAIRTYQHELLVKGQTLETASENWEVATDVSMEFQPLFDALSAFDSLVKEVNG